MAIIQIGIGFVVLIAGRPAYFVFTGAAAFLVGSFVADRFPLAPAQWNFLVVPLFFALIGIGLAFAFKRWAVWPAGFLAGGYLVYALPGVFGMHPDWISPLAAGIVGAACVALLMIAFDLFLPFLSVVTGATLILSEARFGSIDPAMMFLVLFMFGLIAQYLLYEYGKSLPD